MGAGLAMRMRRANGDGGSMMGDLEDEIGLGRMNRLGRMMEEEKEREEGEGEEEGWTMTNAKSHSRYSELELMDGRIGDDQGCHRRMGWWCCGHHRF